jgi:hypothetical protein
LLAAQNLLQRFFQNLNGRLLIADCRLKSVLATSSTVNQQLTIENGQCHLKDHAKLPPTSRPDGSGLDTRPV